MKKNIRWPLIIMIAVFVFSPLAPGSQIYAQWETVFQGSNSNNSAHEVYAEGDTLLLIRRGGGLWFSEDSGATWNDEAILPLSGERAGFHFKYRGDFYLKIGSTGADNFVRSGEDITEWELVPGLPQSTDGTNRGISQVATNGSIIFAHTWTYLNSDNDEQTDYLVSENGDDWTRVGDAFSYWGYSFIGDDLYASAGNTLLMSADTGRTWTELGAMADTLKFIKLFSESNTLYAVAESRTDDFNEKVKLALVWDMETNEWNALLSRKTYRAFDFHTNNGALGLSVYDDGCYYSPDGGESWFYIGTDEFNPFSTYLDGEYFYATGPGGGFGEDLRRMHISNFNVATSTENKSDLPEKIVLEQNYPNPFNPSTVISYQLPVNSVVKLQIYDMLGREVATLIDGERKAAGKYNVTFNAGNLASGIYIYQLKVGNSIFTKKLSLIK